MDWLPLPVFPEGGLSASVIVTVWVGVFVVCLTNLRLGWVLSGLVIPGYMVPLLIAKPTAALVTFGEGILTYLLVWFYSEYLSRFTGWSNFFGRDRFFALVLTSVAVRLLADGWVLPEVGEWLLRERGIRFDYRSNLHSFGLIIGALIANNFWKTGLWRGLWPMAVQVALTWLIVRHVLIEFTNFNIASLGFMYEDMASSFLATPKAYIILLATAFIASRLNLFYGWDFSGILIPSLLALTWYEPIKILTTMVEAVIVLGIAQLVLMLPMFRNITMEGGRKLLLFFNVSFAYKFLLSWALVLFAPHLKISDWFGFGYLLATLIALKIHDKGIFARLTRATLQTSLTGLVAATAVGFALLLMPDPEPAEAASGRAAELDAMRRESTPIADVLIAEKTAFYGASVQRGMTVPLPRELDAFSAGVRRLLAYRDTGGAGSLASARVLLGEANYDVILVEDTYLLLQERAPRNHWGAYVLRLDTGSRLLVEVPAPVDDAGSFEAGLTLFSEFGAGAFASAGAARSVNEDRSSDVLSNPRTVFQAFHRELAAREVLQVRRSDGRSVLHTGAGVPAGIALDRLEKLVPGVQVRFDTHPERNLQRRGFGAGFAEVWLASSDLTRLRAVASGARAGLPRERLTRDIGAELLAAVSPEQLARPGSRAYRAPSQEELLRMEREILAPLFAAATASQSGTVDGPGAQLAAIAGSAAAMGMNLRWLTDTRGDYLLLHDRKNFRGWVLVRAGWAANLVLGVARPLNEAGTLEMALAAFRSLDARALIIAGAAPDAGPGRAADPLAPDNTGTLFNLAHQAGLRTMGEEPGAALLVRALAMRPGQGAPAEDAVLSMDSLPVVGSGPGKTSVQLVAGLESMGLSIRLGSGQSETAGLEALGGPLGSYMSQTRNKRLAVLWVSPLARRQLDTESLQAQGRQFLALGIPVRTAGIAAELASRPFRSPAPPAQVGELARQYLASGDIVVLSALQERVRPLRLERIEDDALRGAYLLFTHPDRSLAAVLSLTARDGRDGRRLEVAAGRTSEQDVARFLEQRMNWMVVR